MALLIVPLVLSGLSCPAAAEDPRSELAKRFNTSPDYFVLNMPPRPGCWPGSIYSRDMRLLLVNGKPDDPSFSRGPEFDFATSIEIEVGSELGAKFANVFGLSAAVANSAAVSATFKQARIYDITFAQARSRLHELPDEERRPPGPVIIYRAYHGLPSLILVRRAAASAEAWATLKQSLTNIGAKVSGEAGDSIAIEGKEPLIFAFEILEATDVAKLNSFLAVAGTGCYGPCGAATTGNVQAFPWNSVGTASNVSVMLGSSTNADLTNNIVGLRRVRAEVFERNNPTP